MRPGVRARASVGNPEAADPRIGRMYQPKFMDFEDPKHDDSANFIHTYILA